MSKSTGDTLLEQINKKISELRTRERNIQKQLWPLEEKRNRLRAEKLISSGLLSELEWDVKLSPRAKAIYLKLFYDKEPPKYLLEHFPDWHSEFVLVHNSSGDRIVHLRMDDGDITMWFEDNDIISEYIEKWDLTVYTTYIDEEIAKLENTANNLRKLKVKVKGA